MLLANMAVAHQIYRSFPQQALLRRHPPPHTKLLKDLMEFCNQVGLDIDFSSAGTLHVSALTCRRAGPWGRRVGSYMMACLHQCLVYPLSPSAQAELTTIQCQNKTPPSLVLFPTSAGQGVPACPFSHVVHSRAGRTLQVTPVPPSLQWEECFSAEALTGTPSFPFLGFAQQAQAGHLLCATGKVALQERFLSGLLKVSGRAG